MAKRRPVMPGAGRKKGVPHPKTINSRDAWKQAYAGFAKAAYKEHVREARAKREKPTELAPPADVNGASIHHMARLLNMTVVLAISAHQYQAAIQGLQVALTRCYGREPYQLEHGGSVEGTPIQHIHRITYVESADLDGDARVAPAPTTRGATRTKKASRKA